MMEVDEVQVVEQEALSSDECVVNRSDDLLRHVSGLWNDAQSSDIVISANGVAYNLHRIVLSQSPVLRAMLSVSGKDPVWQESSCSTVELTEVQSYYPYMETFLKFFYIPTVNVTSDNLGALLYFSDKYSMENLLDDCLLYVNINLVRAGDILVAFRVWKSVHRLLHHQQDKYKELTKYILSNFEQIMCNDEVIKLIEPDDMMFFTQANELYVRTEFTLFKTFEKWLLFMDNLEDRWELFNQFAKHIRYPYMVLQQLGYVENSPLRIFFCDSEKQGKAFDMLKMYLCDAYKFHCLTKAEQGMKLSMLAPPRMYVQGGACMEVRLYDSNIQALATWSKVIRDFTIKDTMSKSETNQRGFTINLMRKMNATQLFATEGQQQQTLQQTRTSLLSLEITQNSDVCMPFYSGCVFVHECTDGRVNYRHLTDFKINSRPAKIMLADILDYDEIVKNSKYSYIDSQKNGRTIRLALDIFLKMY